MSNYKEWMKDASKRVMPNSYAEEAMKMIAILYETVEHVANCEVCSECSMHTELALEKIEEMLAYEEVFDNEDDF